MKSNTNIIANDNSFDIVVSFKYDVSPPQIEECHGYHDVGNMVYTELVSVELKIKGRSVIDILPLLTEQEKYFIISCLCYE